MACLSVTGGSVTWLTLPVEGGDGIVRGFASTSNGTGGNIRELDEDEESSEESMDATTGLFMLWDSVLRFLRMAIMRGGSG